MEEICEFISNYATKADQNIGLSVIQLITDDYRYLDDIIKSIENDLHKYLGKDAITDVEYFYDNLCVQQAPIISFKYKNVCCNICEHFDSKRDYWRVSIVP
jgi:hypothetical protein